MLCAYDPAVTLTKPMMANSGDACEDDDSSSLILDPNLVASLAKPARKSERVNDNETPGLVI